MKPDDLVSYCGVYCPCCSSWHENGVIVKLAVALLDLVNAHGFHYWMPDEVKEFDYNEFHKGLSFLADSNSLVCNIGCKKGDDGNPFCTIRKCAREKGIDLCFDCEEFPCEEHSGNERILKRAEEYRRLDRDEWLKLRIKEAEARFEIHTGKCYEIKAEKKQ